VRLLAVSFLGIVGFALLILGAQVVGHAQPLPSGLAAYRLTECALPCWLGIVPGETTFEDALERVNAAYPVDTVVEGERISANFARDAQYGRVWLEAQAGTIQTILLHPSSDAGFSVGDIANLYDTFPCFRSDTTLPMVYGLPESVLGFVIPSGGNGVVWQKSVRSIQIRIYQRTFFPCPL
jgi:hypothetical protein